MVKRGMMAEDRTRGRGSRRRERSKKLQELPRQMCTPYTHPHAGAEPQGAKSSIERGGRGGLKSV